MNVTISQMLKNISIESPNEMQKEAIETIGRNSEIVLLSPTGSGKTLAFLLPMIERLGESNGHIQAVIITPSRELALQTEHVFKSLGSSYRVACCYGGHPFDVEQRSLASVPDVLVGTPGRLVDHIESHSFTLDQATWLVLDEFDKSLEFGFSEEMKFIIENLPNLRKKILLSATEAIEIPEFTKITNPVKVNYLSDGNEGLTIKVVNSPVKDKLQTLFNLLCHIGANQSIIFCNFRESVDRVAQYLREQGIECITFHGGMEQPDRERALCMFRNGTIRVLISTDLAARGLDIPDVGNVIHYHLPDKADSFTHRNGRTARMHAKGCAYLILHAEESIPEFLPQDLEEEHVSDNTPLPPPSAWKTLYIGKGKKDKISKGDVVGFLMQKGMLKKEDLGIVEVKERYALAAVKAKRLSNLIRLISDEKIKGTKTKFEEAKITGFANPNKEDKNRTYFKHKNSK